MTAKHVHHWLFDGDDPYILCDCGERRDVLTGAGAAEQHVAGCDRNHGVDIGCYGQALSPLGSDAMTRQTEPHQRCDIPACNCGRCHGCGDDMPDAARADQRVIEAERALNRLVPLLPSTARVHADYSIIRVALRANAVATAFATSTQVEGRDVDAFIDAALAGGHLHLADDMRAARPITREGGEPAWSSDLVCHCQRRHRELCWDHKHRFEDATAGTLGDLLCEPHGHNEVRTHVSHGDHPRDAYRYVGCPGCAALSSPLPEAIAVATAIATDRDGLDPERVARAFWNVTQRRWNSSPTLSSLPSLPNWDDIPEDQRVKSVADGAEVVAEYVALRADHGA